MNDWKCYPASLDDFEDMRIVLDEVADAVAEIKMPGEAYESE